MASKMVTVSTAPLLATQNVVTGTPESVPTGSTRRLASLKLVAPLVTLLLNEQTKLLTMFIRTILVV